VDKTTFENKEILGAFWKCCQISSLDSYLHLFNHSNFQKKLNLEQSLYEILQILSVSAFDKTPVNQLFMKGRLQKEENDAPKPLILFDL
jgi:hypothetical protein